MGKKKGLKGCYICGRKHDSDKSWEFPDDMPMKFRWCCNCLLLADRIVEWGLVKFINDRGKIYVWFERIRFIRRAKKVNKLINLA